MWDKEDSNHLEGTEDHCFPFLGVSVCCFCVTQYNFCVYPPGGAHQQTAVES